ncbi:hypothetical protein MKX03_025084 [Papaver bracteatum]|nr:hypothetical protein MKX03_025084 [Papaver bracteatum]
MVLQMCGAILSGHKWDVMVDQFFYREHEEAKDEEADKGAAPVACFVVTEYGGAGMISNDQWGGNAPCAGDATGADWTGADGPVA